MRCNAMILGPLLNVINRVELWTFTDTCKRGRQLKRVELIKVNLCSHGFVIVGNVSTYFADQSVLP